MLGSNKNARICFGNARLNVKIAGTVWRRIRGLMGIKNMTENEGMLFVFKTERRRSFWMAGVLIPLDIIWLNAKLEIVEITKDQQPCRTLLQLVRSEMNNRFISVERRWNKDLKSLFCPAIKPEHKSKYVLEVNAGTADKLGLRVSDKAELFL